MATRAAEPVVKIEMTEGRVHVVAPQQTNHPPPEPDAFRIAGRAADLLCGLGKLFDLALRLLGDIGGLRRGLIVGLGVAAALGEGG